MAKSSHSLNHEGEDESTLDKLKKEIEASQENALGLCTEKVLLARQAYDLVSSFFFLQLNLFKFVYQLYRY